MDLYSLMAISDSLAVLGAAQGAWLPEQYLSTHTCAQAAGLCSFSGFKSESALRLGKAENRSLAARVAVQATTVSPEISPARFSCLEMCFMPW